MKPLQIVVVVLLLVVFLVQLYTTSVLSDYHEKKPVSDETSALSTQVSYLNVVLTLAVGGVLGYLYHKGCPSAADSLMRAYLA